MIPIWFCTDDDILKDGEEPHRSAELPFSECQAKLGLQPNGFLCGLDTRVTFKKGADRLTGGRDPRHIIMKVSTKQGDFFRPGLYALGHLSVAEAVRGTRLGRRLWGREIRKLTETGHQTAVLSTDYRSPAARLGPAMFARWSQENFFRYMRQSYNLDGLADYGTDIVPDTIMVVNPAYRTVDGQARKKIGVLNRKIAEFGAVNLEGEIEP